MINPATDPLFGLATAMKKVTPVDGRTPSIPTGWRWCTVGIQGIRLEHVKVGRRICTTEKALSEFLHKLAATDRPIPAPPPTAIHKRSPEQKARDIAAARARLAKAGI